MLNDRALAERRGSPRLRLCVSAGEALPEHIGKAWRARFGVDILDGVGSTEMLHIFLANAPGDIVYGTSGKAVPGYELRLLDDRMQPTPDGEIGELYVRGAVGGRRLLESAREEPRDLPGRVDAHRRQIYARRRRSLHLLRPLATTCSRSAASGFRPSRWRRRSPPIPPVLEAAVVPAEDEDGLLKPKAFIVLKEGAAREGLAEALKAHVQASVGVWKYPRWIEIVDALPKTATGKIQRFKLREQA